MLLENKENNNNINTPFDKLNKNPLSVIIKSYKEKYIERKSDIFYLIQLTNNNTNKKWELEKTITDFQILYEKMLKLYPDIPSIPKITIFKITSLHTLDKRKYALQYFLQHCINRKYILLNKDFITFLELPQNIPEILGNSIIYIQEFNEFNLSVKNFIFNKNKKILIVSCSDNDFISRDEINLKNVLKMKNKGAEPKKPLGYVIIYEYINENKNNNKNIDETYKINKIWEQSFLIQINIIFFDEQQEVLCIGNDDGGIYIYKTKTKENFREMESVTELRFHNDRVSGLYLDPNEMNLYSCSYDSYFFVTDLKDNQQTKSLIYNNICGFTGLKFSQKNNLFLTSDEDGMISVFTFEKNRYKFFINIQTTSLDKINSLHIYGNNVITGSNNGKICIIDLSLIKDKSFQEIITFDIGINSILCVDYNQEKDEIIFGDEKGRVFVWNNKIRNFIYSLEAHKHSKLNYLWFDNDNNYLLTCGDDKKIKIWKIPEKWFKEDKYLYANNYNDKQNNNIIFDVDEYESISSDEDELNGWSNK